MLGLVPRTGIRNRGDAAQVINGALTVAGAVTATGNMSAPRFLGGAGSAALPTFSFTLDPDTGFYNNVANGVGTSCGNANVFAYATTGNTCNAHFNLNNGAFDITMGAGGQVLADVGTVAEPGYAFSGRADQGIVSTSSSVVSHIASATIHIQFGSNVVTAVGVNASGAMTATSSLTIDEIAAPAAPAANKGRLYVVDVAGKSRLAIIFPSGAAQTIATEP